MDHLVEKSDNIQNALTELAFTSVLCGKIMFAVKYQLKSGYRHLEGT